MSRFVVMTAAAKMPSSLKFGKYKRVAVVETDGINFPKQINPTHNAVIRIVKTWERCNVGHTNRCAYQKALAEAKSLADRMNSIV